MKHTLFAAFLACTICWKATPCRAQYDAWSHSGSVFLLTTPDGAALPAEAVVEGFPLLVRLHSDFFDFRQASPMGADIRFAMEDGKTSLAYQIDEWDPAHGVASIWVRIPAIKGHARQEIKLFWGRPDAQSESNGQAVFNESNGYLSVWHMHPPVVDEVGTLQSKDTGTTTTVGMIGAARHFPGQKGIFCGEMIPNYPSGNSAHNSEGWFRADRPNSTILGWGNEGGGRGSKVRMLFQSPPHIHIDSDFSDVNGDGGLSLKNWHHVVHTYDGETGRIYIDGRLNGSAKPVLNIKSPARMWIGGWYHNYDFVGDIDEVRISQVARSPHWIRLQYENQKQFQTLVGPVVQPGSKFSVSHSRLEVAEGQRVTVEAIARGAQKITWIARRDGVETTVAVDRLRHEFNAGRVVGDTSLTLFVRAVYPSEVQVKEIAVTVKERIPEPVFTLQAPANWDGRRTIELAPQVANLKEMQLQGAGELSYAWSVDGLAVIKQVVPGKLLLRRSLGSGPMQVSLAISNGGPPAVRSITINVQEPQHDPWLLREPRGDEQPEDNQFFARDDSGTATVFHRGTLQDQAEQVFVKLYADEKLVHTVSAKPAEDKSYAMAVKLKPGLIRYRTEFGTKSGAMEKVLHSASNLVCGDAFLIDGQSNADATDVGREDPTFTSDWIRSFGSMAGDPAGSRLQRWANAVVRDRQGGKGQIGYWGMELARRLVEQHKVPVCIINGAVGGTRIDQHQRNPDDPSDVTTIYGRLLWRVRQARLTHGIRGVLWHQGENDQGADGPTGGYGWETYESYFVDMAANWKSDYPNIQHIYVFQIWPKACSMGINGSDNKLREVQRTLPTLFSNLSVMSTLGIKPPGGCHFPKEGYAEFARLIAPLVKRDVYQKTFEASITAPNLKRAYFTGDTRNELALEFDQPVVWSEKLTTQFHFPDKDTKVLAGSVAGHILALKLNSAPRVANVTYLDSASWNPDNLLLGQNGIAALTFCDVPVELRQKAP